jgi:bacillithiol biosynthesis cysteine-adding enzyme BshC
LAQTSRLFADYVEHFQRLREYFDSPPSFAAVKAATGKRQISLQTRRRVVEILRAQNLRWGAGRAALENLDRFAGGAAAVVTGQQVGLFGGPAYSFYKALTAIAAAEHLRRAGKAAVPIFWLASEDHDLVEVNHTYWSRPSQGLQRLVLEVSESLHGHSVGGISLPKGVDGLVQRACAALDGPGARWVADLLAESYKPGTTFADAFARLFVRLFASHGLLLIDPSDSALHEWTAPTVERVLAIGPELSAALLARTKQLERAGYHAQVKVHESSTLLFLQINGRRTALRRKRDGFEAGGQSFTLAELIAKLHAAPQDFSANALLRPVIQDTVLPTAAYVAGPAEIAYLAQSQVLNHKLCVRMPVVLPRGSFTLVEPAVARLLAKYSLSAEEILLQGQRVRSAMERRALPRNLSLRFDGAERQLAKLLKGLQGPIGKVDQTLAGALETAGRKMQFQLLKLRGKAGRAADFRSGVLDRHAHAILDSLRPHGELQERRLNLLPLLARNGEAVLEMLSSRCLAHPHQHQILIL